MGPSRICIADELDAMAAALKAKSYAPSSIRNYHHHLTAFGKYLRSLNIDDLRAVHREHIEGFQAVQRKARLSTSTRAQSVQAIDRFFEMLIDRGVLLLNPTAGVQRTHRKLELPKRVPTRAQVTRLLAQANTSLRTGVRDRAILEVLYGSAIRIGELCALTVHDVDLDNRLLRIVRGKGNKGRVTPLGEQARRWLREYLANVRPWWAQRRLQERALFLNNRALAIDTQAIRQAMFNLCTRAGLRRISPHALRHAAATHMVAAGADVLHVQKLLGHARLSTTQIYTRVAPSDVKKTHAATHPRERSHTARP